MGSRGQDPEQIEQRLRQGAWLSPGEFGKLLGRDRVTIHRWLANGHAPSGQRLRHRTIGSYRECHPDDVTAILDSSREVHEGIELDDA